MKKTLSSGNALNENEAFKIIKRKVDMYLGQIQAQVRPNVAKSVLSLLNKVWTNAYE